MRRFSKIHILKEQIFVKECEESFGIYENIFLFEMEFSNLISYSADMYWSCAPILWKYAKVWQKFNYRDEREREKLTPIISSTKIGAMWSFSRFVALVKLCQEAKLKF
jgi:hypothetical protein